MPHVLALLLFGLGLSWSVSPLLQLAAGLGLIGIAGLLGTSTFKLLMEPGVDLSFFGVGVAFSVLGDRFILAFLAGVE